MNQIGMVGLAVMGSNLALNMASKGFHVSVYNYTPDLTDAFMEGPAKGNENISAFYSLEEFVSSLEVPRKVFLMIRAGAPVDSMIEKLLPVLSEGDIIIDGGNSHYDDTIRRCRLVEEKGLRYIGTGVSGGEEGALHGPCMMPGGSPSAWPFVKDIFQSISAHTEENEPCCDWVGQGGAGHFVKMVHNGIEYGDMELICETYQLLKNGLGLGNEEMQKIFAEWNAGELNSYLIEITADILGHKEDDGTYTVDNILDTAGQKGTGKWTSVTALDEGIPLTLISEAVFARCLSAMKEERVHAAGVFGHTVTPIAADKASFIEDARRALFVAKIMSYAQGYSLMAAKAKEMSWDLNYGGIALMWRGGCIIRSQFLSKIRDAFTRDPALKNLLLDDYFTDIAKDYIPSLRRIMSAAVMAGIPMPAFSAALNFFDGYTTDRLPANLLQAQRDYFGAHTYEKLDQPRGVFFHTNWTGEGGNIQSTTYNA